MYTIINSGLTIFSVLGKIFGLRAADEHASLLAEQFVFGSDTQGEYVRFQGRPCKNNQGGLKTSGRVAFKDIKQYAQPKNPRCYVKLLKMYLKAIPKTGPFYRRPLAANFCGDVRFSKQKMGVHQFEGLMQKICKEAGLEGYFTGHSGKVCIFFYSQQLLNIVFLVYFTSKPTSHNTQTHHILTLL